jgi:hypothetical protein
MPTHSSLDRRQTDPQFAQSFVLNAVMPRCGFGDKLVRDAGITLATRNGVDVCER